MVRLLARDAAARAPGAAAPRWWSCADASAFGDAFLLERTLRGAACRRRLRRSSASHFSAKNLAAIAPGQWHGPIESGYGAHLVFVSGRTEGRVPRLDEVREAVVREWDNARRQAANDTLYEGMLKRYTVTIEPPPIVTVEHSPPPSIARNDALADRHGCLPGIAPASAFANEVRPGVPRAPPDGARYLRRTVEDPWSRREPAAGTLRGASRELHRASRPPRAEMIGNAFTERWTVQVRLGTGSAGTIHIAGLMATMTDVLVLAGTPRWHRAGRPTDTVSAVVFRRSGAATRRKWR